MVKRGSGTVRERRCISGSSNAGVSNREEQLRSLEEQAREHLLLQIGDAALYFSLCLSFAHSLSLSLALSITSSLNFNEIYQIKKGFIGIDSLSPSLPITPPPPPPPIPQPRVGTRHVTMCELHNMCSRSQFTPSV